MISNNKQIPNLTAIRFFLAMLVVIFHTSEFFANREYPFFNNAAIFHKGTEAVYMFFSLSGFLIIKQLYNEKKLTKTIKLKYFYFRRALRIFPLYYLILTIGFLYYQLILPNLGFNVENNYNLGYGLLLGLTFFPNILQTYNPGGILEILWSIGIEEQFYLLVAPVLLIVPLKKIQQFLLLFTGAYFLIYFSKNSVILRELSMLFFYFSFSGFCAIFLENVKFKSVIIKLRHIIFIIITIYFITNIFLEALNPFYYNLFSFLLFGLAISTLSIKSIKILQNKILMYLGKISYGIYMFHALAIQLTGLLYLKIISKLNLPYATDVFIINLLVIIGTILISYVSYIYYESYFLKRKQRYKSTTSLHTLK
ncbi:acyltransferase family protein [Aestuariibaculum sediminum]|uniref:Acyltransferase n=1 Tax=Aestuariibaculum sediminum TaxID=2770637 RepID=A0A8J6Q337_9FLAO|nr:acyltransferase [Aestuariibaculum sediminum]MBD0833006.1 acyltransferase [Aestuariibaculum sediminum]